MYLVSGGLHWPRSVRLVRSHQRAWSTELSWRCGWVWQAHQGLLPYDYDRTAWVAATPPLLQLSRRGDSPKPGTAVAVGRLFAVVEVELGDVAVAEVSRAAGRVRPRRSSCLQSRSSVLPKQRDAYPGRCGRMAKAVRLPRRCEMPTWWNGRHAALERRCLRACGSESRLRPQL